MLNTRSDEILLWGCVQSAARYTYQIYITQTLIPAWFPLLCHIDVEIFYIVNFSVFLVKEKRR